MYTPATEVPDWLLPCLERLEQRRYFKLIVGGSFSALDIINPLVQSYALAGVDVIDISADRPVVEATLAALEALPATTAKPLIMVSFPLDDDPHFRKIQLDRPACIDCGACVSTCPTQVFSLPKDTSLTLDTPRCYGCARCLPACPTDALSLEGFSVYGDLAQVLANPTVQAVEIHSHHVDTYLAQHLWDELGDQLQSKWISLCFRPQLYSPKVSQAFVEFFANVSPYPILVQVDGAPMSGTMRRQASLPALEAARAFAPYLPSGCYLTISGGINHHTAEWLKHPQYRDIHGIGMGTVARQWVWPYLNNLQESTQRADTLLALFNGVRPSAVMRCKQEIAL